MLGQKQKMKLELQCYFSIQVTSIHLLETIVEQSKKLMLFRSSSQYCQAGHWYTCYFLPLSLVSSSILSLFSQIIAFLFLNFSPGYGFRILPHPNYSPGHTLVVLLYCLTHLHFASSSLLRTLGFQWKKAMAHPSGLAPSGQDQHRQNYQNIFPKAVWP